MEGDRCDFCGVGRLRSRRVREYYRVGKDVLVIDEVPAYVCGRCGERYYDAKVAKQMRVLAKQRSAFKEKISFPRVNFKKVAASA